MTQKSQFLSLNLRDILYSVLLAGLAATITTLVQVVDAGHLPTIVELLTAGKIGLTTALSYLLKNILSNSKGSFGKKETDHAIMANGFTAGTSMQSTKKD